MNINLLPDKFIKNRAMDIILIATGCITVLALVVLMFLFVFYQVTVTNYTSQVRNLRMEKVTLEKKVREFQTTQLVDLQEVLLHLKEEQRLATSLMRVFSETAQITEVTLLSYDLLLDNSADLGRENLLSGDGSPLLPSLSLRVRGDFYTGGVKFKEALEKIDWVYDVKPISISKEVAYSESDYIVRLKSESIPVIARLEKTEDD